MSSPLSPGLGRVHPVKRLYQKLAPTATVMATEAHGAGTKRGGSYSMLCFCQSVRRLVMTFSHQTQPSPPFCTILCSPSCPPYKNESRMFCKASTLSMTFPTYFILFNQHGARSHQHYGASYHMHIPLRPELCAPSCCSLCPKVRLPSCCTKAPGASPSTT